MLATIAPAEILALLRVVERRGARETAHRLRQRIHAVFKLARVEGWCLSNPVGDSSEGLRSPAPVEHHPALIDVVGPGGIFGYMPLLTGAGMDFEARTAAPSTLIRLPGALVRAQFAKPAGLAFLASSGWNRAAAERPMIAPARFSACC